MGPLGAIAGHLPHGSFDIIDEQDITLDEFIFKMVENPKLHLFWTLPSYIDNLSYVGRLSDESVKMCFKKGFNHDYKRNYHEIPRMNTTENKGYKYYFKNGLISKCTNFLLCSHPEFQKYRKYLWKKV